MSMDLTSLTATMSLADAAHIESISMHQKHHHDHHHQSSDSGASTPPSAPSSADRTPESERIGYDLDPLATTTHSEEERETKGDRRISTSRKHVDPSDRRTVFIPNLPRDATQREVHNMFAFCPGFVKVQLYDQLKTQEGRAANSISKDELQGETNCVSPGAAQSPSANPNGQSTPLTHFGAFVLFDSPQAAQFAKERLHGLVFDHSPSGPTQAPVVLQARIAMKNLFLSREEQAEFGSHLTGTKSSRRGSFSGQSVIPPAEIARLAQIALAQQQHAAAQMNGALSQHQQEYVAQFSPLLQSASTPPFHAGGYSPSGYHSPALNGYAAAHHPPALQSGLMSQAAYYTQDGSASTVPNSPLHSPVHHQSMPGGGAGYMQNGSGHYRTAANLYHAASYGHNGGHHSHGHSGHHSSSHHSPHGVGPFNPPCTTLFLARLEQLSNEELFQLLINSFPTMTNHKFMIDSKGQRIAFVEFDSIESASVAQQRINGYCGISCQFSKNPLGVRK